MREFCSKIKRKGAKKAEDNYTFNLYFLTQMTTAASLNLMTLCYDLAWKLNAHLHSCIIRFIDGPNCLSHQRQTIFCGAARVGIICVNQPHLRHLRQKIQVKSTICYFPLSSLRLCAFAPLRLNLGQNSRMTNLTTDY
jgi:hypothetical protein